MPLGSIYVSDGSGKYFTLSIDDVLRGIELVDFEKINSLEGVFLANKYEDSGTAGKSTRLAKNEKDTFSKLDVDSETFSKSRMSQGNSKSMNKKQQRTKEAVTRESSNSNEATRDIDTNIKTYITHNKGGKWELIKAPTADADGKKVACYLDEGCSLHLQIYSSDGNFAPPYSQESSVGLVIAVGNVGANLDKAWSDRMGTYLSRDGGLNWS